MNTVRKTIDRLSRARGPNPGKSIRVLIGLLATLWEEVTGLEPTASSEETYRTAFESFALAAAVAFLPTELWFAERKYLLKPGEKNKFINGTIDSAVLQAIREMRATGSSRRGRPPRG
jgi:hypothetical protein